MAFTLSGIVISVNPVQLLNPVIFIKPIQLLMPTIYVKFVQFSKVSEFFIIFCFLSYFLILLILIICWELHKNPLGFP